MYQLTFSKFFLTKYHIMPLKKTDVKNCSLNCMNEDFDTTNDTLELYFIITDVSFYESILKLLKYYQLGRYIIDLKFDKDF